MIARARTSLFNLRQNLFIIPSAMIVAAFGLSQLALYFDNAIDFAHLQRWEWLYTGDAEGARVILSTVAGSIITIAGVVFSVTLVAISLVSSQLGQQVLPHFMRDTSNQLVLGTFMATFIYSLLVLRQIQNSGQEVLAPAISIALCLLLATASLAMFVFFIHHISEAVQVNHIVEHAAQELLDTIDDVYPGDDSQGDGGKQVQGDLEDLVSEGKAVNANRSGYIQNFDQGRLLKLASRRQLTMKIYSRTGDFIMADNPLVFLHPDSPVDKRLAKAIRGCFMIGKFRTPIKDPLYDINLLVQITLRTLSPAMNDPLTAMISIDRIGEALVHIVQRGQPSPFVRDRQGAVRLIVEPVKFRMITEQSLGLIRQYGLSNPFVNAHVLVKLCEVIRKAHRREDLAVIAEHAALFSRTGQLGEAHDREQVDKAYQLFCELHEAAEKRLNNQRG